MAPWAMYGEVQGIAWSSLRHVGPQTLRMGSGTPDLGCEVLIGSHPGPHSAMHSHRRHSGEPSLSLVPWWPLCGAYRPGGQRRPFGHGHELARTCLGHDLGSQIMTLEIRRTRFRVSTPRLTNLGSQNGHPGRPQIRGPPVELDGIQWNSPLWNVSLDGPLGHAPAFHGIPWSQILRIAHSDLPKWSKIGHFWGPKWSILAIFGIKLGPKLVILGSKMAHFGGPNSSKEPRNTHLVAVYPPNMPIWAIWALLAIWVGNGVFYPFSVHFDQMGQNMTVRRSTVHGPN